MAQPEVTIWFNPRCAKCRGADELLAASGVAVEKVHYLDDPPPREEIVRVLGLLGAEDPRAMMRTGEAMYEELGLDSAEDAALIDAMVEYPELIERPIVIRGQDAVVARPPELLLDLLEDDPRPIQGTDAGTDTGTDDRTDGS